ncbi:hypothetical protein FOMPIDRAFT_1062315 [Fomitopsis schrenkii]|uniref:Uncharacterized protein n=1 Tax=Fomitopsis schrenkii TaxID=2126942 RepID=S8DYS8_FOMSC|nr:hypothetical protein FOMPIDRAFT_1062315 [Fomitopsis schrenkii]
MPTQMREWNPLGIDKSSTGPIDFSDAAASSSQHLNGARNSQGSKENRAESAAAKPKLPGFVNAFDSPSPRAASQPSRAKGKQREGVQNGNGGMTAEEAERNFFAPSQPSSQNASSLASSLALYQSPPSPPSSPLGQKLARRNGKHSPQWASPRTAPQSPMRDVEMPDSQEDADVEIVDEFPDIVWAAEVHRIILTHRRVSSTQPTMQLLMGASLPENTAPEHRDAYARLSRSLLEVMGVMLTDLLKQDHAIQSALDVLIQMADVLQACSALEPMLSLLGMLRLLVVLLPAFSRLMFVRPEGEEDKADVFLDVVCRTTCCHLAPVAGGWSAPSEELAKETLGLLGDLAWVVPDEYGSHLGSVPSHPGVLSALLAPTHPTWFLRRSVQTLVLLASHHGIFRSLLTVPEAPANVGDAPPKDFSKIPHIEQLAAYLRDTTRTGKEAELLKDAIMTFVVTLCMAHEDAVTILQQSHLLIPSVVAFLSHITTPLFEEEPELVNNAQQLEATVMRSVRSVSVLYTLVRGADNSSFNLYNKLRRVATRDIPSMFDVAVVTLARLSWADPPLEASDEAKLILEEGIEITGILIEDIIDAPQLEDVWLAFQVDEERQLASQKPRDVEERGGGQDEDEDLLLSQEV